MSISSSDLYGSATIVNTDLFNDGEDLKEQVTTLTASYLITTEEHRNKIDDTSGNKIPALESDIFSNFSKINDISDNKILVFAGILLSDISLILVKLMKCL
jgi:hypothetical protein